MTLSVSAWRGNTSSIDKSTRNMQLRSTHSWCWDIHGAHQMQNVTSNCDEQRQRDDIVWKGERNILCRRRSLQAGGRKFINMQDCVRRLQIMPALHWSVAKKRNLRGARWIFNGTFHGFHKVLNASAGIRWRWRKEPRLTWHRLKTTTTRGVRAWSGISLTNSSRGIELLSGT